MAALRVQDVDLDRRRVNVTRAVTEDNGHLVFDTTKTGEARSVAMPRFLAGQVADQIKGRERVALVFEGTRGGVLRNRNFTRRTFAPAAATIGVPELTSHALRHTAASLAVGSGASVLSVQRMLGHASPAITLNVYAGLFEDSLDDVADPLDATARDSAEILRTSEEVGAVQLEPVDL